ncbi:MAG TPA: hypothetical protein HPP77_03290 [Candidatus Hydrogenedentes bacterium]|nr:hypothetical protein [Candidatus Hydrogenedentota bacterium]HIJ74596.1 hypothetical protein [Candidatus Hydrogenedentota bacterium]
MLTSPDFKELLSILAKYRVRYLVVGGYAVMRYTEPRFTKDLDLWILTDEDNAKAVFGAPKEFGAPLVGLTAHDFTANGYFYQMGKPPFRLDIMMSIPGVEFETAWQNREEAVLEGLTIPFISRSDLIRAKDASGRAQDLLDAESLRTAEQERDPHA